MSSTADQRTRRIVITGAMGNVGSKVAGSLQARPDLDLTLIDRREDASSGIIASDLRRLDKCWTTSFAAADTVIHLAANPSLHADWPDLLDDNVEATLNVFHAAAAHDVRRFVLASSLHAGSAEQAETGTVSAPSRSPYGVSKAIGERIGRHFAESFGLSVICLRLGMVRQGPNRAPHGHPNMAAQQRWLSNRDLCRAVNLAIDAEGIRFAVVNVTSRIEDSPWSLADARSLLDYEPLDHFTPVPESLVRRSTRVLQGLTRRGLRKLRITSGLHLRDST